MGDAEALWLLLKVVERLSSKPVSLLSAALQRQPTKSDSNTNKKKCAKCIDEAVDRFRPVAISAINTTRYVMLYTISLTNRRQKETTKDTTMKKKLAMSLE